MNNFIQRMILAYKMNKGEPTKAQIERKKKRAISSKGIITCGKCGSMGTLIRVTDKREPRGYLCKECYEKEKSKC